jgi:hypothetical protein
MIMAELTLERRGQQNKTAQIGPAIIAPIVDDDYWSYRVVLSPKQAVLGFPKFFTVGIGFAVEDADWNVNLPYLEDTDKILAHILKNKGDDTIPDADVRAAIVLIQEAAREDKAAGKL